MAVDQPLEVVVVEGEIAITGPEGVAISLTLAAAAASARRLQAAVEEAGGGETYQKPLG